MSGGTGIAPAGPSSDGPIRDGPLLPASGYYDLGYGLARALVQQGPREGLHAFIAHAGARARRAGCPSTIAGPPRGARTDNTMWYVIEGYDGADVLAKRLAARADHLARLMALREAGRLLLAGPCPAIDAEDPGPAGFSGSVVIAEFESLEAARAWADADPYIDAGVYTRVEVRPFRRVLP